MSFIQKKIELMRQLLAPIVSKFDTLLQRMLAETDESKQLAYAQCLSQAMAFARLVQLIMLKYLIPKEGLVLAIQNCFSTGSW